MCSNTGGVAGLAAALDALTVEDPADLPGGTLREQLVELLAIMNRLHAQLARRVALFDTQCGYATDGARSASAWLRMTGRLSPYAAGRLVSAGRLLARLPVLAEAADDGDVTSEHIDRIGRLAERVSPPVLASVERPLAELARTVDPRTLETACARVREHADPDGPRPDPHLDFQRRGITTSQFDGMLLVRGQLDPEGGAALQTALDALMGPPAPGDQRRAAQRRADALVELARGALASGRVPDTGGVRPQVGILLNPQHLVGRPGSDGPPLVGPPLVGPPHRHPSTADPSTADPLTAAGIPPGRGHAWLHWIGDIPDETAQRIACDADAWRVILDPATSRPLELGRGHRLVPAWLRKALHARDRGCRFPSCDAPPAWTDGHHLVHWARGGPTDIDNLISLCRHHHVLVHEGRWTITLDQRTGAVTVRRPGGAVFRPPRHRLGMRRGQDRGSASPDDEQSDEDGPGG